MTSGQLMKFLRTFPTDTPVVVQVNDNAWYRDAEFEEIVVIPGQDKNKGLYLTPISKKNVTTWQAVIQIK